MSFFLEMSQKALMPEDYPYRENTHTEKMNTLYLIYLSVQQFFVKSLNKAGIFLKFLIFRLITGLASDQKLAQSRLIRARKIHRARAQTTARFFSEAVVLTAWPLDLLINDSLSILIQSNPCYNKCQFALYCYGYYA